MNWTLPAARRTPAYLGVEGGKFRLSPKRPSCVSTQEGVGAPGPPPIPYEGTVADARDLLVKVLDADPRATVATVGDDYVRAEYRAMIFLDDVEFYFPKGERVIHMRSTSRVGYGDLGANARRLRSIAAAFTSRA